MPIYLVRWPSLSASLVTASNEEHLLDVLDEVADPTGCTWSVYKGPLFIDFEVPVEVKVEEGDGKVPLSERQVTLGDTSKVSDEGFAVSVPIGDTASEMFEAIRKRAFPNLHRANESALERDEEGPSKEDLSQALKADLDPMLRASWRHQQLDRRTDGVAERAKFLGTSPQVIESWDKSAKEAPKPPLKPKKGPPSKKR